MLEMNYHDFDDSGRHSSVFYEGYVIGCTEGSYHHMYKWRNREMAICRHIEKWPNKELPHSMKRFHELYDELMSDFDEGPVTQDFISFMDKYATLPLEDLCKKIWRESEYWHGDGIRRK